MSGETGEKDVPQVKNIRSRAQTDQSIGSINACKQTQRRESSNIGYSTSFNNICENDQV